MNLWDIRGWAFDLDGVIWAGNQPMPGAADLVAALRQEGRRVVFLTNNSTLLRSMVMEKLAAHGIPASPQEVVSTVETAAEQLLERYGRIRVLTMGIDVLNKAMEAAGHTVVADPNEAEAVVIGRDPGLTYERLTTTCHAVDRGIPFLALNVDARLPVEGGSWLPGVGPLVAAVQAATGRYPEVVGKPSPMLFHTALHHLGTTPEESVMVGDNPDTDIMGGLAVGMWTVQVGDTNGNPEPHLRVATPAELLSLWQAHRH